MGQRLHHDCAEVWGWKVTARMCLPLVIVALAPVLHCMDIGGARGEEHGAGSRSTGPRDSVCIRMVPRFGAGRTQRGQCRVEEHWAEGQRMHPDCAEVWDWKDTARMDSSGARVEDHSAAGRHMHHQLAGLLALAPIPHYLVSGGARGEEHSAGGLRVHQDCAVVWAGRTQCGGASHWS